MRLRFTPRLRRVAAVLAALASLVIFLIANPASYQPIFEAVTNSSSSNHSSQPTSAESTAQSPPNSTVSPNSTAPTTSPEPTSSAPLALDVLAKLEVKGRAPKTGYSRTQFYKGWPDVDGCNLRQRILKREFGATAKLDAKCNVVAGSFLEPYNGVELAFSSKTQISKALQIDHIVALSDAWQKGAQYHSKAIRYQIATDPLNLIAADGPANMQKSDSDAASWLPKNKAFRCQYVARQIAVKYKYRLWVSSAEHDAMKRVLTTCPGQLATGVTLAN